MTTNEALRESLQETLMKVRGAIALTDEVMALFAASPQPARATLICGCIPGVVSPSCTKGHEQPAFICKAQERPSIALDWEKD